MKGFRTGPGKSKNIEWLSSSSYGWTGKDDVWYESAVELRRQLTEERDFLIGKLAELENNSRNALADCKDKLESLNDRLSFIGNVIEAEPELNRGLETFRKLLENDYQEYASQNAFLASDASAMMALMQVEHELEQAARCSRILGKSIVAVGGAFSSGKSSFLNSLFVRKPDHTKESEKKQKNDHEDGGLLPVDTTQATAIASYIIAGDRTEITGCTYRGGMVVIPEQMFKLFKYRNMGEFKFNIKRIISDIVIKTQFVKPYENICFVDTPGYNPGSGSDLDRNTALTSISEAQALIWCFNVTGGSIHNDDFRILREIIESNPKIRIYIVATNADVRSIEEREEILEQTKTDLEINCIDCCEGMSLYSSLNDFSSQPDEYAAEVRGKTLTEFLDDNNKPDTSKEENLLNLVRSVFDEYISADDEQIRNAKKRMQELRSISGKFEYILGKKDEIIANYKSRISKKDLQRMSSNAQNSMDDTEDDSDAISQIIGDSIKDLKATLDTAADDKDDAESLCRKFEECIGSVFKDINVHKKTLKVINVETADHESDDAEEQFRLGLKYYTGQGAEQDYDKALSLFRAAAEKGVAKAQYRFGRMYFDGDGVNQNYSVAFKWFKKAADHGDSDAMNNLGNMYYNGQGVGQNYEDAVLWYQESAEQGNAEAQKNLGDMYRDGLGVDKDGKEAVRWYLKSAEQENADAQFCLGDMYYDGEGVEQDYDEAFCWFSEAAEQGDADAQFCLGNMYYDGHGVEQDYDEALKWYRKSAEQGNADAQLILGDMYRDGRGVGQNSTEALDWYMKSAEQGNVDAQFSLANMYYNSENYSQAAIWCKKSADRGNAKAQLLLGNMYKNGHGVEQDYAEALKWFQRSAGLSGDVDVSVKMSNADVLYRLGWMYLNGECVEKDYAEGWKLLEKSAELGNFSARLACFRRCIAT